MSKIDMSEYMKKEIFMRVICMIIFACLGCSATSIPQNNIVKFMIDEEVQLRSIKVDSSSAYQSVSLEINIQHIDSAERYDFMGQEWDLLIRSSSSELLVPLYRDDQELILQRIFTRDGLARLHGLLIMERCTELNVFPRELCIPCETETCTFHYDFVRSGQPLRKVEIQLLANGELSEVQSDSDATISLEPIE